MEGFDDEVNIEHFNEWLYNTAFNLKRWNVSDKL